MCLTSCSRISSSGFSNNCRLIRAQQRRIQTLLSSPYRRYEWSGRRSAKLLAARSGGSMGSWTSPAVTKAEAFTSIDDIVRGFERFGYVLDMGLATAIYLVIKLGKPLLIEGHAGVGKTEVAK